MEYSQAYNVLKQAIIDNSYTYSQVQATTKKQVATILGVGKDDAFWSGNNVGFYMNLKNSILVEMQDDIEQTDMEFLKSQIDGTAFRERFPNFVVTRHKRRGRRILILHLGGLE